MALTVGIDSYVSVANADAYFVGRYGADVWTAAITADKEAALKTATLRIDSMGLLGKKKVAEQVLEFPRCYSAFVDNEATEVCDSDVLPNVLRACYEEALAVLEGKTVSKRIRLQEEGVKSFRAGNTAEVYTGGVGHRTLTSPEAVAFLRPYVRSAAAFA